MLLLHLLMPNILSPFIDHSSHIFRQLTFKMNLFACLGMNEAEFFGVQCLSLAEFKTIIDKLFVFGEDRSSHNAVAAIKIIIE